MSTTSSPRRISVGDEFPDMELVDHAGETWHPSRALGRPLVLILHRHLG